MKLVKLTTNGRVTVPAQLRIKYGLTPGRKVKFEAEEEGIKMIPLVSPEEVKENSGFLRTKGKLLRTLMDEKDKEL